MKKRTHTHGTLMITTLTWALCTAFPGPALAAELIQEVSFDQGELAFTRIRDFDLVFIPGTDFTREVGAPMLPARAVHILLPPGSSFEGIEVDSTERETLGRGYRIFPCQPPAPTDGSEPPPFVGPSSNIYDSLESYPSLPVSVLSESRISGYHLVSIRVYPLTYVPATGELILNRSLALAVSYQPGPPLRPGRRISLRSMEEMNAFLGSMVHNPEQLSRYGEDLFQGIDTRTARPLRLEVKPSRRDAGPLGSPGQIEYIVVTTEELASEFEPLVDWKTRKGIPAAVATLEWIVENVPNGCDLQETIRNFLIEAKQDHPGLAYVLIGGDVDVVPARMAGPISGDSRPIPTDLYYADIDPPENDWNADGDWLFGEIGDGADAVPDLFVGRAPVSTPLQAAAFVEKTLFWERELPTDHHGSVLMLGASAGSGGDGTGAINKKAIGTDFIPPEVLVYYLCAPRDGGGWACDDELTRTTTLHEINAGYGLINHQDHSSEYCIGAGSKTGGGTINRSDMDSLVNGPFYSILWTLGCSPGAFDYDCALEHFVRSPGGGGPAAVGNSRTGYWSQNSQDRAFMEAVYQLGMNLGQAHSATKTAGFSLYHRYIQNILGDPELSVNTDHLGLLTLDLPPQATTGPSDITITVNDNKSLDPVEGAVVCAMKGSEDYAVGITDEQGQVIFSFDPNTPGEILVTATKTNYYPAEASIPVVPRWAPHIYLSGWNVDDDGSGSSSGNGDGVVDAGESVEIPVTLANSGLMPAYWVLAWIELVEPGPYVSIADGYEIFYTIPPGGEILSPDDFDIEVSPDCPAGHAVEVRLWIWGLAMLPWSGPAPIWWTDTFDMEVSAPDLCIASHSVDDDNGNGLVDPGETVELPLVVKNYSKGTAVEVDGTIVVSSVDVEIIEGSASFGDVLYLEEVPSESPFVFRASKDYDGSPLAFDFVFVDLYGNTWEDRIVVSGPLTPPAGLTGEAGVDDVQLFWDPHPGTRLAGYHVYRSSSEGGPYARADHELIRAASYFHDTGLSGATFYYYIVTAVDESGRESAPSGELAIQTTIEPQQGWPIGVGGEVSSPLVLDLDGDGDIEVIFGAGDAKIYAFHHGGEEVLDIDQNPTTISGFAVAVGTVGTPSAGDIDGDGSLEIVAVANSGSTHEVYAWRAYDGPDEDHEADLVEGWPVSTSDRIGAVSVPALADVDGDGTLEIFVGGDHKFYGWRHDGTGIVSPDGVFLDPGSWIYGTAALGDLSGDGVPDVVIGGGDDGILYALDGEANDLPGLWPVTLGGSLTSSPAMGDLDGDGSLEVVVASMADKVHVLEADGTPFGHFWPAPVPQNQSYSVCSSVLLGDLDGDGTLEVVVGSSDKKVYAWAWDGSPLDGWPTAGTDDEIVASPALGDLDGDGAMEVVVSTSGHFIYAWRLWDLDLDGAADVVPGWPINMGGAGTSPAIVDLDGDGDVEVASGSMDSMMFFWDCAGPYDPVAVGWGQFHHDPMRTGFHP